jgi:hypothetical protein
MNESLAWYSSCIERMNAVARQGRFKAVPAGSVKDLPVSQAYRRELKQALRAIRHVIADEANPEVRGHYVNMLQALKHLHYCLITSEDCVITLSTLQN